MYPRLRRPTYHQSESSKTYPYLNHRIPKCASSPQSSELAVNSTNSTCFLAGKVPHHQRNKLRYQIGKKPILCLHHQGFYLTHLPRVPDKLPVSLPSDFSQSESGEYQLKYVWFSGKKVHGFPMQS